MTAARLIKQVDVNDDGTKTERYWDAAGAQEWSQIIVKCDVAGRKTLETVHHDDGRHSVHGYDAAGVEGWSKIGQNFDVAGRKTDETVYADDGSRTVHVYDVTGAESWSKIGNSFDAAGRRTDETVYHDDGRRAVHVFDAASVEGWSTIGQNFDAAGRRTDETVYHDDGRRTVHVFDAANVESWSAIGHNLDAAGRKTDETVYHDDGTRKTNVWDVGNVHPWRDYEIHYDRAGREAWKKTNFNNGHDRIEQWDTENNHPWAYIETRHNALGWSRGGGMILDSGGTVSLRTPVALDLDGNGLDIKLLDESDAEFDWAGDGTRRRTAWIGPQDGLLAIDLAADGRAEPDGLITLPRELAFIEWAESAGTDLEGLRLAFDSNRDGTLDSRDSRWSEFRIWRDQNQDGRTDPGELRTLDDIGIAGIELTASRAGAVSYPDGSAIIGLSSFIWANGRHGAVADLVLSHETGV
jgi:hypothetical protein